MKRLNNFEPMNKNRLRRPKPKLVTVFFKVNGKLHCKCRRQRMKNPEYD